MNAAQIAHFLKDLGKGSEVLGIANLYRAGRIVGAVQALVRVGGGYIIYRIGKWGYEKLVDYMKDRQYLTQDEVT